MKASSGTHKAEVVVKWMPLRFSFKRSSLSCYSFLFFYSLCCEPQC